MALTKQFLEAMEKLLGEPLTDRQAKRLEEIEMEHMLRAYLNDALEERERTTRGAA